MIEVSVEQMKLTEDMAREQGFNLRSYISAEYCLWTHFSGALTSLGGGGSASQVLIHPGCSATLAGAGRLPFCL